MLQQPIGCDAEPLVTLLPVTQGMLASLLTNGCQCLLQVKIPNMVININHDFNWNWMFRPLCRAKMMTASIM